MDPMVSARVPMGLRDAVNQGLKEIGSSPTELINSAYEYFLANRALPGRQSCAQPGRRVLGEAEYRALEDSIMQSSRAVPDSFFAGLSDDQLLAQALRSGYEALA